MAILLNEVVSPSKCFHAGASHNYKVINLMFSNMVTGITINIFLMDYTTVGSSVKIEEKNKHYVAKSVGW